MEIGMVGAGAIIDIKSPRAIVRINGTTDECADNPVIINTPNSNIITLLCKDIPHNHVMIGYNIDLVGYEAEKK